MVINESITQPIQTLGATENSSSPRMGNHDDEHLSLRISLFSQTQCLIRKFYMGILVSSKKTDRNSVEEREAFSPLALRTMENSISFREGLS